MDSLEGAKTPSSAKRRAGALRSDTLEGGGSSLTAGYGASPSEGRERPEPEAVEMKTLPAKEEFVSKASQEVEVKETGKELPQETLEVKEEKIEVLKKEAGELMAQIEDKEKADAANDEYGRLEELSNRFYEDYPEGVAGWAGLSKLESLRTEMNLHNWTKFVEQLKGATEEDLKKNVDLTESGKRFQRLYTTVENAKYSYERHLEEENRIKAAHRERLRQTITPYM
ncbi:hypothetical protein E3J85_01690 [Patescibacteria group bacterium]|nr:MAG: hypothetical protein E3J85_01690 [Patescibacteria group bacterium]